MNTQRRIFRGRGGPTDGRLPKHNARRRRQHQPRKPAVNKYDNDDDKQQAEEDFIHEDDVDMEENDSITSSEESVDQGVTGEAYNDIADATTTLSRNQQQEQTQTTSSNQEEATPPWVQEIQHLKQRIKNIQESIQTGTAGIANPKVYQTNVLNATENCLQEWNAILKYYPPGDANNNGNGMDPIVAKETALEVYVLIQHALQCGPLAGGKPGYFKRCGGTVARMVLEFLNKIAPPSKDDGPDKEEDEEEGSTIYDKYVIDQYAFSAKQAEAIATWKHNAAKAAEADKPPSKTALKKQEGKSKKKKLKKNRTDK